MIEIFEKRDLVALKNRIESDNSLLNSYFENNPYWDTPLILSCRKSYTEFVDYLISKGVDLNIGDKLLRESDRQFGWDKSTPLHISCNNGDNEISMKLIENGAKVNPKDDCGMIRFYYAIKSKNIDLITLLIENGAELNEPINSGQNSVFYAIEDSDLEILKILVENGADINKNMAGNWTPILSAISINQYEIVKYLVDIGADFKAKTEAGWDIHYLAKDKNRLKQILKKHKNK